MIVQSCSWPSQIQLASWMTLSCLRHLSRKSIDANLHDLLDWMALPKPQLDKQLSSQANGPSLYSYRLRSWIQGVATEAVVLVSGIFAKVTSTPNFIWKKSSKKRPDFYLLDDFGSQKCIISSFGQSNHNLTEVWLVSCHPYCKHNIVSIAPLPPSRNICTSSRNGSSRSSS